MNKLLIILPIISILVIGGILQFKNTDNVLQQSAGIPNTLTFQDWAMCYMNLPTVDDKCISSDEYNQVASQFADLTHNESENIISACQNYYQYFSNTWASDSINSNNFFTDCFLSQQVLEIAQSNQCFYEKYFAPLYLKCTQFVQQEHPIFKQTRTFSEWAQCYTALPSVQQPCQTTDEYYLAASQFNNLTYSDSENITSECKNYYAYYLRAEADQPLNQNNYYENCFLSSAVQSIVNSNSCFRTYFYQPTYVQCAGF